jgi:four helix bundle protein
LKVYEKSINLVEKVYRITKNIPKAEQYGVISQIQRAVTSIVANIAEGNSFSGQFPKKELNFLAIAKGSADEVRSWLDMCLKLGYITEEIHHELDTDTQEVIRMLFGMIKKVKQDIA